MSRCMSEINRDKHLAYTLFQLENIMYLLVHFRRHGISSCFFSPPTVINFIQCNYMHLLAKINVACAFRSMFMLGADKQRYVTNKAFDRNNGPWSIYSWLCVWPMFKWRDMHWTTAGWLFLRLRWRLYRSILRPRYVHVLHSRHGKSAIP